MYRLLAGKILSKKVFICFADFSLGDLRYKTSPLRRIGLGKNSKREELEMKGGWKVIKFILVYEI